MTTNRTLPLWMRRTIARALAGTVPVSSPTRQRRFCIHKVDRLGDFVLALGALRLLTEHLGAAECRLVVSAAAAPLAAAELPDVERWTIPANASGVLAQMWPLRRSVTPIWSKERFETLVSLRHARSLYRDLTLTWINAEQWCGLGPRPAPGNLALGNCPVWPAEFPAAPEGPWCRELLAHRIVVERMLGRAVTWEEMRPRPRVCPPPGAEIVLCPCAGERIREYPDASWATACRDSLPDGATLRVLGPSDRQEDLGHLVEKLRGAGLAAHATADATASQFIHAIATARLVLTVESAAAHLATAFDRPAVVVMGGGHYDWFAPWGASPRQRWIQHRLPCYGCNWTCRRPTVACLADLPGTAITEAIGATLLYG